MKTKLLLTLTLLCCACVQLGGAPQQISYYRLESPRDGLQETSTTESTVGIKLIDFPDFLNRQQIVTHDRGTRVRVADDAHWAEPVADNLTSVLRRNLKRQLPLARIALLPWEKIPSDTLTIELLVNDFSGQPGTSTWVDIDWTLLKDRKAVARGRYVSREPIGSGYEELSAQLSRALSDFSRVLAEKIIAAEAPAG